MTGRIVTDEEVHDALECLRSTAEEIGRARRAAVLASHYVDHIEAIQNKLSDGKTADARKYDARASDAYKQAIDEDAASAGRFEAMKAKREAASATIEAWRSQSATLRSMSL